MKKLIALALVFLAACVVMPAFAATAGPEDPAFVLDATPVAGAVDLYPAIVVGEKEVILPQGRSTALLSSNDTSNYFAPIELGFEECSMPAAILNVEPPAPPGYYLLV